MSATQTLERQVVKIGWKEVYDRLKGAPNGRLFGIPRGGSIVAGLTGRATDDITKASVIVDDVVDSGLTRSRFTSQEKKFWALVDKEKEGIKGWVQFPWEVPDSTTELHDTVVRQLELIGEDVLRDGLLETPKRVARSLRELTEGYLQKPASILSKVFEVPYDEMVLLNGIEFWSLCEHHMLPFHGTVSIGYIPRGKVVGISKLARLVHCFSRRLQVQERMTQEIAHAIKDHLDTEDVGVLVKATHLCMALRGVKTPASMVTSCLLGAMRKDAREEFLRLSNAERA